MALAKDVLDALGIMSLEESVLLEALFDSDFYDYIGCVTSHTERSLDEKMWSKGNGLQPWAKIPDMPTATSSVEKINAWVAKNVMPFVDKDKQEFNRLMQKVGAAAKSAKVLVDIKKAPSILDKIQRGKDLTKMHDILRGAVLVKEQEDLEKVKTAIRKTFKLFEEETKDFGKDTEFGYFGSVHYTVELSSKVLAEIQVMTKELWSVKNAAHVIYDTERKKVSNDKSYAQTPQFKAQQKTSKNLFMRGSGKKIAITHGPNMRHGKAGDKKAD